MKLAPAACAWLIFLPLCVHSEPYLIATAGSTEASLGHYERNSALRLGAGYRLSRAFSVEASYLDLGTYTITHSPAAAEAAARDLQGLIGLLYPGVAIEGESLTGELALYGVDIALHAQAEITRGLSVYGRVGAVAWTADQSHSLTYSVNNQPEQQTHGGDSYDGLDLMFGMGVYYRFDRHWGATLEAINYATADLDSRYMGAGLKYFF